MGGQIGLFGGKKVFDPKYLTAEIMDASNNIWFVPIKYIIGDFFLTEINKQVYAFKLDGTRIKTSKAGGARSFTVIHYDVSHYLPISQADIKAMEIIITRNSLPKLNNKLLGIVKIFGKREKEDAKTNNLAELSRGFEPHNITQLIEILASHPDRYDKEISELINFSASLDTDKIVTPVKRMVDFIEGDLKTVDAKFMGSIFSQAVRMDEKAKKILNPLMTAKKSWLVLILAIMLVCAVIGLLYFAYKSGAFDAVGGIIPSIGGGGQYDQKTLMSKYPNCAALRVAIDSKELDYTKLPKDVQKIADSCPSPTPTP